MVHQAVSWHAHVQSVYARVGPDAGFSVVCAGAAVREDDALAELIEADGRFRLLNAGRWISSDT